MNSEALVEPGASVLYSEPMGEELVCGLMTERTLPGPI
jgi:hypothetical protein